MRNEMNKKARIDRAQIFIGLILALSVILCSFLAMAYMDSSLNSYQFYLTDILRQTVNQTVLSVEERPVESLEGLVDRLRARFEQVDIVQNTFNRYKTDTVVIKLLMTLPAEEGTSAQEIPLFAYNKAHGFVHYTFSDAPIDALFLLQSMKEGAFRMLTPVVQQASAPVRAQDAPEGQPEPAAASASEPVIVSRFEWHMDGVAYALQTGVSAQEPYTKALPSVMVVVLSVLLLIALIYLYSRYTHKTLALQSTGNEVRLQRVLDGLTAYIYVTRLETDEILFMNRAMREGYGLLDGKVTGEICWKLLQEGMEARCPFCPAAMVQENPTKPYEWEENSTLTGRTYHNVDFMIEWDDGAMVHMQQSTDVTETKNVMRVMERQLVQQKLLAEISTELGTDDSLKKRMGDLLQRTGLFLGADIVGMMRCEPGEPFLTCEGLWSPHALPDTMRCGPTDIPYIAEQWNSKRWSDDQVLQLDSLDILPANMRWLPASLGLSSITIAPLRAGGKHWGVLCYGMFDRRRVWDDQDISFIQTFSGLINTALQRSTAQEDLNRTQRTLSSVMEHIPLGVYWKDSDSRYLGCNRKFSELLGIDPERVVGRADADIFPAEAAENHVRTDQEVMRTGKVLSDYMKSSLHANAKKMWIRRNKLAVYEMDGEVAFILGILEDTTQRMNAEKLRDESLALLRAIMENYPGVIWSLDAQMRFTMAGGFQQDAGGAVQAENWVGRSLEEMYGDIPEMLARCRATFTEGAQDFTVEYGNKSFNFFTAPMLDENQQVYGIVATGLDVSMSVRLQHELEEAIMVAEEASNAKSDFLSRMSHEIRTPMNVIIGMCRIALRADDPERIKHSLGQVDTSAKHLLGLINDILDMSKIEANKFQLHNENFNMESMLMNVSNNLMVRANERDQTIQILMSREMPRWYVGDELRLSQVLTNLFTNAIKFSPDGGNILLSMKELSRENGISVLEGRVRDHGIGMTQEQVQRLFTSFEQADGGIARKYGGTGLGLAICKSIVTMMDGEISVESEPEKGSTFIFTIKMACAAEQDVPTDIPRELPKNLRVMIVDDLLETCDAFAEIMEGFGVVCDKALSGAEALDRAKRAQEAGKPYDVVFVDWRMPEMDGIETARHLHAQCGEKLLIIMVSGADITEVKAAAEEVGIKGFVTKPLFASDIFNVLTNSLGLDANPVSAAARVLSSAPDLREYCVLLAEDMEFNREVAISMLEETGCAVDEAKDGLEAVALFQKDPMRYGCILMDMQMPELDGLGATRRIRALPHPWARKIPIIAMTANVFREDIEQCLASGMDDHIGKPIEDSTLYEKLAFYLHSNANLNLEAEEEPVAQEEAPQEDISAFRPHVNVEAGLARARGNRKLYATLLSSFQRNTKYSELSQEIAQNHYEAALTAAHALKSVAANVVLEELLRRVEDVEPALRASSPPQPHLVKALDDAYRNTIALLPRVVQYLAKG